MNQVNTVIKTLFHGISDDEMNDNLDTFLIEYTDFNYKNFSSYGDDFIWSSKDIIQGNSHICHQKYYLPCTKVLGFLACMVVSRILTIAADERS